MSRPDDSSPSRIDTASVDDDALVALARETRRSAEGFAAAVHDFNAQMPNCLDRVHTALRAFRACATNLRNRT